MSLSIANLAALITVIVAAAGGVSAMAGHWLARRQASGRVATSEAAILWQQSQDLRAVLLTEKTRAEDQRDRLIEAYTSQVLPALAEISAAVTAISVTVADNNRTAHALLARQEGGENGLPAMVQGDGARSQ